MTEAATIVDFPCRSRAVIALEEPDRVLDELLSHMTEHATVIRSEDGARLESPFATVEILRLSDTILVDVHAPSDQILAMIRHFIAEHVFEFAGEEARIEWSGDGAGDSLPPQFRQVRVIRAFDLTPRMRRLVFSCERPEIYVGDAGYHVRLLLPPEGRMPRWPQQRPDGRLDWPLGEDALTSRVYTIREVDVAAGTLAVDFVLHEGGISPGADFARRARPGDVVGLMGPGGDGRPQGRRLLLLGDEAALPAIARMIADLPAGSSVTARIVVEDAAEVQAMTGRPDLDLAWIYRADRDEGAADPLEEAVAGYLASGLSEFDFLWAGCEKNVAHRIRKALLARHPDRKKDFRIYAYWQGAGA